MAVAGSNTNTTLAKELKFKCSSSIMKCLLLFFGLLLSKCVFSHVLDEKPTRPIEQRFRILSDGEGPDFSNLNVSQSHRRLAMDYFSRLQQHVTHERLSSIIHKASGYMTAVPFPHMSADNIFPSDVVEAINLEIPDNPTTQKKTGCATGSLCYNSKDSKSKGAFSHESEYGPATLATFHFMQSSMFMKFLERLTGVRDLVPDRDYIGSGIHQTLSGGFLNVHADFNLDRKNSLHRRVNAFVYLNPDWKDEYGGHLELWTRDLKNCSARILPTLGRFAVFTTTDFSYHGHQRALTCPKDRSRRSMAMYYYTKTRPSSECIDGNCFGYHTALFKQTFCPDCESDKKCFHRNDEATLTPE